MQAVASLGLKEQSDSAERLRLHIACEDDQELGLPAIPRGSRENRCLNQIHPDMAPPLMPRWNQSRERRIGWSTPV